MFGLGDGIEDDEDDFGDMDDVDDEVENGPVL